MRREEKIKKEVRQRDAQRCVECGMPAAEHKRQFGGTLPVHRKNYKGDTSLGPYEKETSETLCRPCHEAKHHLKAKVRKRDGYACRECGMTREEHREVYDKGLEVHCPRGDRCSEWEWKRLGVQPEECVTLCEWCHQAKHSLLPAILTRDGFRCVECGRPGENRRVWDRILTVHQLTGECILRQIGLEENPEGFVTLCHECHETKHPDRLAEYVSLGGQVRAPAIVEAFSQELGVTLPITSKEQLVRYKEYRLLVNVFIDYFAKNGRPLSGSDVSPELPDVPGCTFSLALRTEAAKEALRQLQWWAPLLSRKEEKRLRQLSEAEKMAYLQLREEEWLEGTKRMNAAPTVSVECQGWQRQVKI